MAGFGEISFICICKFSTLPLMVLNLMKSNSEAVKSCGWDLYRIRVDLPDLRGSSSMTNTVKSKNQGG